MESLLKAVIDAWNMMSGWEITAVILAIAYLILALKENSLCWYAAFISTAIYTVLFWNVSLLMESVLQVYYMAMAIYGWYQWRQSNEHTAVEISRWSMNRHLQTILLLVCISLISGYFLNRHTSAAWPYLDSFTTWGSVITTYMVAKKILENWIYWVVIDALCVFLYMDRGLHLTSLLFVGYTVIAVFGFIHWKKTYQQNLTLSHA